MAAKRTLKYKRNRMRPITDLIDRAIDSCLRFIESPGYKGTMSDLIRLIRLKLKLNPPKQKPRKVIWIDGFEPT